MWACIRGHKPRHAKSYVDFVSEHARLRRLRVEAFAAFRTEVADGRYPAPDHTVPIADAEFDGFRRGLETT